MYNTNKINNNNKNKKVNGLTDIKGKKIEKKKK
jgi:hypothetical protein